MLRVGGSSKWQEDVADVGDPSDWLGGSFSFLKELDGTLRCEICSDILRAPVSIKTCSHVFCSTCIRDYINQPTAPGAPTDRPCPNCRQPKVYDSELVPMPQLEVAAEAWRSARSQLQQKDSEERARASRAARAASSSPPASKKRRVDVKEEDTKPAAPAPARVTRSSASRGASAANKGNAAANGQDAIVVDDDSDDDWSPSAETTSPAKGRANGVNGKGSASSSGEVRSSGSSKDSDMAPSSVVQCPMCQYDFTLSALNRHLDTAGACKGPDGPPPSDKERGLGGAASTGGKSFGGWFSRSSKPSSSSASSSSSLENATKLKRPQYQLLPEKAMRRLCEDAGLSTSGSKAILEARHRHWVDRYNANLDAAPRFRKSLQQLRREAGQWDREKEREEKRGKSGGGGSSSGAAANGTTTVGSSEEERRAYAAANKDHFRELVEQSKRSLDRQNGKQASPRPGDDGEERTAAEAPSLEQEAAAVPQADAEPAKGTLVEVGAEQSIDDASGFEGALEDEGWEKDLDD